LEISFTLPFGISKNHSHRNSTKKIVRRKDGRTVYQRKQVKTDAAKQWVSDVQYIMASEVNKTGWTCTQKQDVDVRIVVYIPDMRHDGHNCEELLFDSMQGVIYDNDRYVAHHSCTRRIDKDNPRIEVRVSK
jgi:hypothetical protein